LGRWVAVSGIGFVLTCAALHLIFRYGI
jgi:hypothetical protein